MILIEGARAASSTFSLRERRTASRLRPVSARRPPPVWVRSIVAVGIDDEQHGPRVSQGERVICRADGNDEYSSGRRRSRSTHIRTGHGRRDLEPLLARGYQQSDLRLLIRSGCPSCLRRKGIANRAEEPLLGLRIRAQNPAARIQHHDREGNLWNQPRALQVVAQRASSGRPRFGVAIFIGSPPPKSTMIFSKLDGSPSARNRSSPDVSW